MGCGLSCVWLCFYVVFLFCYFIFGELLWVGVVGCYGLLFLYYFGGYVGDIGVGFFKFWGVVIFRVVEGLGFGEGKEVVCCLEWGWLGFVGLGGGGGGWWGGRRGGGGCSVEVVG